MQVKTFIEWQWIDGAYRVVREKVFEYDGPCALCDRSTSGKIANQGIANSGQDQTNAQSALTSTNDSLKDYSSNLNNFLAFGRNTYGQNGEFARDQNTIANTTASAGTKSIAGNLALNAGRTGANTAGYAGTLASSTRDADQALTSQLAGADATRLQNLTNINQYGVSASALPAEVQAGLYGTSVGGANAALSGAGSASAAAPSFADTLPGDLTAAIGAAGTAAAGFCPCEGSLIRMADGSDKLVQDLKKGDWVWSMGSLMKPNEVLTDPEEKEQEAWEIVTTDGHVHRGSDTHTLALATGGYVFMPEALSQTLIGEWGRVLVTAVKPIGKQKVYPFKVGGSHCYMADGISCLV